MYLESVAGENKNSKDTKIKNENNNFTETIMHLESLIKQYSSRHLKLDFKFNFEKNENFSYQCLFFWCLLNARIELAKFFWKNVDVRV